MRTQPAALLRASFIAFWAAQALIVATVLVALYARGRENWIIVSGYLGSVALVLDLWALVLSLRAFWNGDETRWWKVVPQYVHAELTIAAFVAYLYARDEHPHLELADLIVETGAPLFLLYLWILRLIAVPLGALFVAQKAPALEGKQRLVRVLCSTMICAAVLSIFLLPFPLFIYCACPPLRDPVRNWNQGYVEVTGWRRWVADGTPNFVRDAALAWTERQGGWPTTRMMYQILGQGRCSREQLISHVFFPKRYDRHGDDTDREYAFDGLVLSFPRTADSIAQDFMRRRAGPAWSYQLAFRAGQYTARNSDPETIRLAIGSSTDADYLRGLLVQLRVDGRTEFRSDVSDLARRIFNDQSLSVELNPDTKIRLDRDIVATTLETASVLTPEGEFVKQCSHLLIDPERKRTRILIIDGLYRVRSQLRFKIIIDAYAATDNEGRRVLLSDRLFFAGHDHDTDGLEMGGWLTWLIDKAHDDDIVVRRAVAERVAEAVGYAPKHSWAPCTFKRQSSSAEFQPCWNDASICPEISGEVDERDYVCALARDYIARFGLTPLRPAPPSPASESSESSGTALSRAR